MRARSLARRRAYAERLLRLREHFEREERQVAALEKRALSAWLRPLRAMGRALTPTSGSLSTSSPENSPRKSRSLPPPPPPPPTRGHQMQKQRQGMATDEPGKSAALNGCFDYDADWAAG